MTIWLDPEGSRLSEVSQRPRPYDFTCMWNLKNQTNEQQNKPHGYREQIGGYQRGKGLWNGRRCQEV